MIDTLKGKRVFVTGATGFIGGAVTRQLDAIGAHPVALERTPGKGDDLRAAGIEVVRGDITDEARMHAILEEQRPYAVLHIAAWLKGKPLEMYQRVNVDATVKLAQAAMAHGVARFVYTSSIMVYNGHGDANAHEDYPLTLYGDPYGDSKIRSEWALWEATAGHTMGVTVIRPGMVYGPRSRSWTVRLAKWARSGRMPLVDGGQGAAYPVYVANLVDLILLCAVHEQATDETFNGTDDGPISYADFLGGYMAMVPTKRALRLPGWLLSLLAYPAEPFVPLYNVRSLVNQMRGTGYAPNDKAKRLLGWSPRVSMAEGLRQCEAWLHEAGYLQGEGS